jgi:hypothetical protein
LHLVCVQPAQLDEVWPHVAHLIHAAMDKMELGDFAVLERQVFRAEVLLWLAVDIVDGIRAAAVTQVAIVNGNKYCTIVACGGAGRMQWLPLIDGLEAYAKSQNCKAMRIFGRFGWKRVLPHYQTKAIVLERTL